MRMIHGERLRQVRELADLTQEELARLVNVEQSLIALIEGGRKQPSEHLLNAIALATGFPPAFFRQPGGPDFPEGSLLYRAHAVVRAHERAQAYRYAQVVYEAVDKMARRVRSLSPRFPQPTTD